MNSFNKLFYSDSLVYISFSMDAYENLNKNELNSLRDNVLDFFDFVQTFKSKLKIRG